MTVPTGHAVPFYCPYCGEEDLEPGSDEAGRWHCRACDRHLTLRFLGVGAGVAARPGGTS